MRSIIPMPDLKVNSTGRRNTSSVEVSDGQAFGVDDDADGAAAMRVHAGDSAGTFTG
jgi:hypothetical protein